MRSLEGIHEDIEAIQNRLEELAGEVESAAREDAECEAAFKNILHSSWLIAKTSHTPNSKPATDSYCEAWAMSQATQEHLRHLLAKGILTSCRDAIRVRTAQLDGLRTMAASYRSAGG